MCLKIKVQVFEKNIVIKSFNYKTEFELIPLRPWNPESVPREYEEYKSQTLVGSRGFCV